MRTSKEVRIERAKERLQCYLDREAEMLKGGVQSYGLGTRNATRYNTDLAEIRRAITDLENEIDELSAGSRRKAVGVVPRDW